MVSICLHPFRWMIHSVNTRSGLQRGFTLIELLVVIGTLGFCLPCCCLGCRRRGKRHDADPADQCGLETPTWLARILPFIEQASLGDQWDFSKPWHEHPEAVRTVVPDIFLCPSRRSGTRPIGNRSLRTTVTGGGGRLPCGCPIPPRSMSVSLDIEGALSDYAGNHGDLTPGATGAPTDFYYGGNGTGVIISVRPSRKSGQAIAPSNRIRMASVSDGTSSTFLFGE